MKIRNGFVSNSSSSSFLVKVDSDYFRRIQQEDDFHYKEGSDLSRCTGVYDEQGIDDFVQSMDETGFLGCLPVAFFEHVLMAKINGDKVALVMISDEQMGGTLSSPTEDECLLEWEYH